MTGSTSHLILLLPPSCPPVQCMFGLEGCREACGESEVEEHAGTRGSKSSREGGDQQR